MGHAMCSLSTKPNFGKIYVDPGHSVRTWIYLEMNHLCVLLTDTAIISSSQYI